MELRLRPVREDELPQWLAESRREYIAGMIAHAGLSSVAAEKKADAAWSSLVRDGRLPESHALFVVETAAGTRIGRAWLGETDGPSGREAYVYDVFVEAAHRGCGLGKATMGLLEDEARRRGHDRIGLHVFGGNDVARYLYHSLGYAERSVSMGKDL